MSETGEEDGENVPTIPVTRGTSPVYLLFMQGFQCLICK